MMRGTGFAAAFFVFILALSPLVSAGLVVQNGAMNSSSDFFVGNGSFFVNATSGYVGVGTLLPARPLQVVAAQDANIRLQDASGSPAAYIEFYNDTSRWGYVGLGGHDDKMVVGTTAEKNLSFYANDSQKMVLTAAGYVGIGTSAPSAKLAVNGSAVFLGSRLAIGDGSTMPFVNVGSPGIWLSTNGSLATSQFVGQVTGTTDRVGFWNQGWGLVLDNVSNVGIGMVAPSYKLDVAGTVNAYGFTVNGSAFTGGNGSSQWTTSGSNIYYSAGNVGIGTSNPNATLHMNVTTSTSGTTRLFAIESANEGGSVSIIDGSSSAFTPQMYMQSNSVNGFGGSIRGVIPAAYDALYGTAYDGAITIMGLRPDNTALQNAAVFRVNNYVTNLMTISANGNVGIGASSPSYKLDVAGNVNVGNGYGFCINGACTTNFGTTNYWSAGTGGIYNSGNVGIGTSSPLAPLDVKGDGTLGYAASGVDLVAGRRINLWYSNNDHVIGMGNGGMYFTGNTNIRFDYKSGTSASNGATRLYLDMVAGNVGIGTTSPIDKLHVAGTASTRISITDDATGHTANNGLQIGLTSGDSAFIWMYEAQPLRFATSGTERMRISSDGKVGIGTTSFNTLNGGEIFEIRKATQQVEPVIASTHASGYPSLNFMRNTSTMIGRIQGGVSDAFNSNGDGLFINNPVSGGKIILRDSVGNALTVSGGNVGIGTANPSTRLHVYGESNNAYGQLKVESSGNDARISLYNIDGATATGRGDIIMSRTTGYEGLRFLINGVDQMILDENGNVGINVLSPAAKLDVYGQIYSSTYGNQFAMNSPGTNYGFISNQGTGIWSLGYGTAIGTLATPVLSWTSGGNVGIGTTTPGAGIDFAGTSGTYGGQMRVTDGVPGYPPYTFRTSSNSGMGSFAANTVGFSIGGTEKVRIDSSGNVGIGTVSPEAKLHVSVGQSQVGLKINDVNGGAYLMAYPGTGNPITGGYFALYDNAGTQQFIVDKSNGRVGIGTASPSYTLTVAGTAWVTSGAWSGSDGRWKKNVTALLPSSSLEKVLALKPVNFEWRTNEYPGMGFTNGTQVGFIAQDVEKVIPEVVTTDDKGYKGMSYEKLTPVLTGAVQAQQAQIANLTAKNTALESQVGLLQDELCRKDSTYSWCN